MEDSELVDGFHRQWRENCFLSGEFQEVSTRESFSTSFCFQIHLEVDPSMYESDDQKYQVLMKNEGLRLEIFGDVLGSHLGLNVDPKKSDEKVTFTRSFLLGRHEVCQTFTPDHFSH